MEGFLLNYKKKDDIENKEFAPKLASLTVWTEKYRPKNLNEVAYQDEVINALKKCMTGSDLPNLLFYGPPGTGKTSTILAAAKELYGKRFSDRVLELNASDDRGISVIRERVKAFSKEAIGTDGIDQGLPTFKLVILDEADSMTNPAQSALRRVMEVECRTTRFCLIGNYITRFTSPIISRCAKFRFKPLDTSVALDRLEHICREEGLEKIVTRAHLLRLVTLCEGDLRRAITLLQSAAGFLTCQADGGAFRDNDFFHEVLGEVPPALIEELLQFCLFKGSHSNFDKAVDAVKTLLIEGYAASQVLSQLHDSILRWSPPSCDEESTGLDDQARSQMLDLLSVADHRLLTGADEQLQLTAVVAGIVKIVDAI